MSSGRNLPVLIIGGGISGLSAAYYLNQAGIRATIVDRGPRPGGVIQTTLRDGCVLEAGPDSFLAQKPWALDLIRDVGLGDQVIGSNDHQRITYILRRGKLVTMPAGLMMMVPTKVWPMAVTPLVGWGTKIRMGLDLLRRPPGEREERSVSDFLREHYGQEAIDYLAEPLLAGVYGGDPGQLSANAVIPRFVEMEAKYGSLSRGMLAAPRPHSGGSLFQTLQGGLGQLVDKLVPSAESAVGQVCNLCRAADQSFEARVNGDILCADQIIIAAPAHSAAALIRTIDGQLATLLETIPYTSSLIIGLVYDKQTLGRDLKGFGFLVPKTERQDLVACTIVNNKFPHRAPENRTVLRCFMGGDSLAGSDAEIIQTTQRELRRILNITADPLSTQIARWPQSMAQYTLGHARRVAEIEACLKRVPGLHLAGNAYHGIGVPDCVRAGKMAAEAVAASHTHSTSAMARYKTPNIGG